MTLRLAISGFGRIGRMTLRAFQEMQRNDMEVVLINSPGPVETSAHLYEFDSVHGRTAGGITYGNDWLDMGTGKIHMTHERDPSNIPHAKHGVDIVLECSGKFNNRDASAAHLIAGAKKVLVSAPCKNADQTIVYGVNGDVLTSNAVIVSNASCTTNCLAPIVAPLHGVLGLENGLMTTIHAFTNDQSLSDVYHTDPYRARSATQSMIPTKTGAAAAIGLVLPELKGRLDGLAVRVPTINVSLVDLTFTASRDTSVGEVNKILSDAALADQCGVLACNTQPLVSSDFNHNSYSSNFDANHTRVSGRLVKVLSWYDNEWGFSNRMLDTGCLMATGSLGY